MAQPTIDGTPEQWAHVATAVRARRSDLGNRTVDEVIRLARRHTPKGVSRSVISFLENGRQTSYSERTLRAASVGLDWSADSIERILDGRDPQEYSHDEGPPGPAGAGPGDIEDFEGLGAAALDGQLVTEEELKLMAAVIRATRANKQT